jgi:dihydrofolate reductase
MIVSLIVAVANDNVIGKDNDLIWKLPKDMKFFKETTVGHHIITGRKNYISIPERFRPLPNRTNLVLTRQEGFLAEGAVVVNSLEKALDLAKSNGEIEAFIIGGGQIYKESIEKGLVDKLYITKVHADFNGDTYFPELDFNDWNLQFEQKNVADEKHAHDFTFTIYQKK